MCVGGYILFRLYAAETTVFRANDDSKLIRCLLAATELNIES